MPFFSILIPSYNAANIITETLESLRAQTFKDWECLVVDDASTDDTCAVVESFGDARVRLIPHAKNVGYAANLKRAFEYATGTCLFLLGNDDILSPICLDRTKAAFDISPTIAVVIRPYYMWDTDPGVPIRYTPVFDKERDVVMSPDDGLHTWKMIYSAVAQLSSLSIKRELLCGQVTPYCFTAHVEPVLASFLQHQGVFLKDYLLAARKNHSQSRTESAIYEISPLWSWVDLFERVLAGNRWKRERQLGVDFVARNVQGLVQIRCRSSLRIFFREVWLHVKYRPLNLLAWRFWLFSIGCLVMPPKMLRRFTDRFTPLVCRPRNRQVSFADMGASE